MLHAIECCGGNVLKIEGNGELTRGDHLEFLSHIEAHSKECGRVRLMLELKDFKGLETASGWEDPTFSLRDRNLVKRLAIIGEKKDHPAMKCLAQPFTEVCFFTPEQHEEAWRWIEEGCEEDAKERIRRVAYAHWEAAGRPECDPARFWIEAEQEVCGSS